MVACFEKTHSSSARGTSELPLITALLGKGTLRLFLAFYSEVAIGSNYQAISKRKMSEISYQHR